MLRPPFFSLFLAPVIQVIEIMNKKTFFIVFSASGLLLFHTNAIFFSKTVPLMEKQKNITDKGGTMRLGAWKCDIKPDSLAYNIYGSTTISERHRHRYEYNSSYVNVLEIAGLKASGLNPETGLVEIVELENHPFFIGVQYHPEYKSTVANPHPLFVSFVGATVKAKKK